MYGKIGGNAGLSPRGHQYAEVNFKILQILVKIPEKLKKEVKKGPTR